MKLLMIGLVLLGACAREPATPDRTASAPPGTAGTPRTGTEVGAETAEAVPYDAQFIDGLIAYAQYTQELAKVGARRAQRDELKVYAKNLDIEQEARLTQLRNWRKLWYPDAKKAIESVDQAAVNLGVEPYRFGVAWRGVAVELDPKNPNDVEGVVVVTSAQEWNSQQVLTELRALPDPAFDPVYTATLADHQRWGMQAARTVTPKLERSELKTMAQEVISANQLSINQIGTWRQEWFGANTEGVMPPGPGPGTR